MIGIQEIGSYIPNNFCSNFDLMEKFEMDDSFIKTKIGIETVSVKNADDDTSDLCVKAFEDLQTKTKIPESSLDCLIVVTQNPDYNLPHCSAIVHGKLDLPETVACFDISLGCSGYVYGLSVIKSFMESNGFKKGILFTSDPYSKVMNQEDKNTRVLFGDAATATLITDKPVLTFGKFNFGTIGKEHNMLKVDKNVLYMNGRAIFNFAAKYVPIDFKSLLKLNKLETEDIDSFIFHQGSKYIVDTLTRRLKLPKEKVPFTIQKYGNTVSSSIPIILEQQISDPVIKKSAIFGFGVGLSWASTILFKNQGG